MGLFDSLFGRRKAAAPPPPPSGSALSTDALREALAPWHAARARPAWKPRVEDGAGAPAGSRFGGLPWLPAGEAQPRCRLCQTPLRLLVQLDLAALPAEAQEKLGAGVLQAFYCERDDCEQAGDGYSPFSPMHLARVLLPGAGDVAVPAGTPFPARAITGWERLEDLPSGAEHDSQGLHLEHDFKAGTLRVRCPEVGLDTGHVKWGELEVDESLGNAAKGDKLLGWADWVQGVEYPQCPRCERQMELVFQLDSEDHLPHMWGDSGVVHVTRCPEHPDVLTLAWACC